MTWLLVLSLAVGAYGFKVLGLIVIGRHTPPAAVNRCLALIPAAVITALIVKDSFSVGHDLVLDARSVGFGAAVLAAWFKAPLILVIVMGAAATAGVRAFA